MTAVFDVTSPADGDPAAGPADGDPGGGTHQATRRRRARSRPLRLVLYGGLVLALVGLAAGAVGIGGHHNDQPTRTNLPPTTARITRQTLVDYQEVDGTVDYRNQVTITAKAHGTVTWLPAVGDRIGRGKPVCRIDNKPIVLLYGALPPYRPLHPDVKGPDVRQFEENLRALGYTGFTVDDECSAATETAVKKWQKDLGLDQTSVVDPAAAMVAPGEIRVAEVKATLGDTAGGPLLTYTSTTRVVNINLDIRYEPLARQGAKVTIELPSAKTTTGTIASVDTVVTPGKDGRNSTVKVLVEVDDQHAFDGLDQAPVQVNLVAEHRDNVLTVPVAALLALGDGGYGVQVVDGRSTRIVKVDVGLFADGKVEVRGDGLTDGTTVGMPS